MALVHRSVWRRLEDHIGGEVMKVIHNNQTYEPTPEQVAEIEAIIGKKQGLWLPKHLEQVSVINQFGNVETHHHDIDEKWDNRKVIYDEIRPTKALARQNDDAKRAMVEIVQHVIDKGYEVGRDKDGQAWILMPVVVSGRWRAQYSFYGSYINIPFRNEADAEAVIRDCAEQLAKVIKEIR